jgi:hypothetical protein
MYRVHHLFLGICCVFCFLSSVFCLGGDVVVCICCCVGCYAECCGVYMYVVVLVVMQNGSNGFQSNCVCLS